MLFHHSERPAIAINTTDSTAADVESVVFCTAVSVSNASLHGTKSDAPATVPVTGVANRKNRHFTTSRTLSSRARGFTLFEMLLAMFVIAIGFTMAALSVNSGGRSYEIKTAAKRLYGISSLAVEEAIVTGTQMGLLFSIDGNSAGVSGEPQYMYQWLEYNDEEDIWLEVDGHEMFDAERLPENIRLSVEIEGLPLIIGAKRERKSILTDIEQEDEDLTLLEKDKKRKQIQPDIYFLSSGEVVEFSITLSEAEKDSPEHQIKGNMVGKIRYIGPADEEEEEEL